MSDVSDEAAWIAKGFVDGYELGHRDGWEKAAQRVMEVCAGEVARLDDISDGSAQVWEDLLLKLKAQLFGEGRVG